ncbi:MAG: pilus (MSHA type) biogenesis protein MshL [Herbaspirillum sp.]
MQKIVIAAAIIVLTGCSAPIAQRDTFNQMNAEMQKAVDSRAKNVAPAQPNAVAASLLPPLKIEMPAPRAPVEERFNLAFNNAPAAQFFNAIVAGTRYNMLVHPDVTGTISANLKDVTLFEALDAIRELYGYDYKVEGRRIYVKPLTIQTRVFQVNYLTGTRNGTSEIRVTSGSVSDAAPGSGVSPVPGVINQTGSSGNNAQGLNSSKINTISKSDFWTELKTSLEAIVGEGKEGRSVVISPQSGVVVVRALPDELKNVAAYLKATQLSVDRQVILEAKILEVTLSDGYQAGINWAAFRTGNNSRVSGGFLSPGTNLQPVGAIQNGSGLSSAPGSSLVNAATNGVGGLFGLAFQTSNFAALLSFLESQGNVHVLSSPRIATLNNQKAVLKVGTDAFFVTNVSTTTTTGTATTTTPSVTLQPFFSGVALDVTPQIDDDGNITLHVHPSVSKVTTVAQTIDLGGTNGSMILPLASSAVSETDSVVRGRDGQIIAIGGLMSLASSSDQAQLPGIGNVPVLGLLARNTNQATEKRELVILLKTTVVKNDDSWSDDILEAQGRIQSLAPRKLPESR